MMKNSSFNQRYHKKATFLPRVSETDPNYKKLKVYMFGNAQFTFLSISKMHKVEQLIMHIVALAEVDPFIGMCFDQGVPDQLRKDSKEPDLYEMRMLADEEDTNAPYIPFYESNSLNRESRIGSLLVNSLAFCRKKEYEETIEYANTSMIYTLISRIRIAEERD